MSTNNDILNEQVSYYKARAHEYDEWWQRHDQYDQGDEETASWQAEVTELEAALDKFAPTGSVLELAYGTGWWTQRVARHADKLTCVDASAETMEINRNRLNKARLPIPTYHAVDLFTWEPSETYDVVFFSFWISHIPPEKFEAFWSMVGRALKPGGRVFFMDTLPNKKATYVEDKQDRNHHTPSNNGIINRRMKDGSTFQIVKIFYDTEELSEHLGQLDWQADCWETENYFLLGTAQKYEKL